MTKIDVAEPLQALKVSDPAVDDSPCARSDLDSSTQIVADHRPLLHLAENVNDHYVALSECLDYPGVLSSPALTTFCHTGSLDHIMEIRPERNELRGH
jgi:hypothetical protein